MLRGGKSGPAIVLGKSSESLLIKKIRGGEMPPPLRLVEASVKSVDPSELELLARWIDAGAPVVTIEPDVAGIEPDPLVTGKDRDFWAFRPPQDVVVPRVQHAEQVRTPIDAFLLEKLENKNLTLAAEADRATLLRRASFDLTGLPPEPAEVLAFMSDPLPDAYERMIERLLASPRYGERWGRHWLDLAGYADSEGKREQDLPRPFAYRYRDYVIRAFNDDKPYDRFLLEQLAGDELADYEHAPEITRELEDNLVATGFLRMAPDPTWANITGFVPDRLEVISDEVDILGSSVMGLTLKCARCHSHKFDPIPHRDYYRLVDVFKGAFDEYDWLKPEIATLAAPLSHDPNGDRHLPYVTTEERRQWDELTQEIKSNVERLKTARDQDVESVRARVFEARLKECPDVLRDDLRAAFATRAENRHAVQAYLVTKFEAKLKPNVEELKQLDADFKARVDKANEGIASWEAKRRPEPKIHALWDRGEPSPTYIARRGDYMSPGRLVGPGVPSVLTDGKTSFDIQPPWPGAKKTGRRLAFARWLTQPDHPLTARVFVNRVWKLHFGTGLVATLDNFGKVGARPSHPELLDWLAHEFVRQGWSIKALHRVTMTSAAYRQSSLVESERSAVDPENHLYGRMPMARFDAESLFDTMLLVGGKLDERRYGPPDRVEARPDGLVVPVGTERGWRRSVYIRQDRKQILTLLEDFDLPAMNPNCVQRRDSNVAPQALHLMNNGMIRTLADHFARRIQADAGNDPGRQIERAYLIALSRPPDDDERAVGISTLDELMRQWGKASTPSAANDASSKALATFCHAILNSADFLYVD
jgi:hypothetical protein